MPEQFYTSSPQSSEMGKQQRRIGVQQYSGLVKSSNFPLPLAPTSSSTASFSSVHAMHQNQSSDINIAPDQAYSSNLSDVTTRNVPGDSSDEDVNGRRESFGSSFGQTSLDDFEPTALANPQQTRPTQSSFAFGRRRETFEPIPIENSTHTPFQFAPSLLDPEQRHTQQRQNTTQVSSSQTTTLSSNPQSPSYDHQQLSPENEERQKFLVFIYALFKIIDQSAKIEVKKKDIKTQARQTVKECTSSLRLGIKGYSPLMSVLKKKLQVIDGMDYYWDKSSRYVDEFWSKKKLQEERVRINRFNPEKCDGDRNEGSQSFIAEV